MKNNKVLLTPTQCQQLLHLLKERFEKNMPRHKALLWKNVAEKLTGNLKKLWSLNEMEITGGEPDVVTYDDKTDTYCFYDCAAESPKGRRSICYDQAALLSRKENKPKDSAVNMATNMGIAILTAQQYQLLQQVGDFDTKTSSWIDTPETIRMLGGALFCDKRYNAVFVYHNGAASYYAARGFRGLLVV
jgi:hypothetical protein